MRSALQLAKLFDNRFAQPYLARMCILAVVTRSMNYDSNYVHDESALAAGSRPATSPAEADLPASGGFSSRAKTRAQS